jgi:peptidoglycan hydrolase-like protein with peptidoglycan-binding domain
MRFREFVEGNPTLVVPKGSRGPEWADLQKALTALGYKLPVHGVDGYGGPETSAAIKNFEKDNKLTIDGSPDEEMINLLNKMIAGKGIKFAKSTEADVVAGKGGVRAGLHKGIKGDTRNRALISPAGVAHLKDPDFNSKLQKVADSLGVDKAHLIAIMKAESGMDPAAVNPQSNATGLIQFMPKTATSLGTTVEELRTMSAVDQLDYVYRYFKMVGVKPGMDAGDLYMAVFMPKYVGAPDNTVLGQQGSSDSFSAKVYAQNSGLDKDRDGAITVSDVKSRVARYA